MGEGKWPNRPLGFDGYPFSELGVPAPIPTNPLDGLWGPCPNGLDGMGVRWPPPAIEGAVALHGLREG